MSPRLAIGALVLSAAHFLGAGCALDFDGYDPRLAPPSGIGGAVAGGAPSSGGGGIEGAGGTTGGFGGTGGLGGLGGGGGRGGSPPVELVYAPVIADCITLDAPDPDACALSQPEGTMGVDGDVSNMSMLIERHSYLRFDFDGALAGAEVLEVALEITVSDVASSNGDSSGQLWEVEPFTRDDLFVGPPPKAGTAPLAGDQGSVDLSETVTFALPTSSVIAGSSLIGWGRD